MDWINSLEPHWFWLALGLILAIGEITIPGVFLIWLAAAALVDEEAMAVVAVDADQLAADQPGIGADMGGVQGTDGLAVDLADEVPGQAGRQGTEVAADAAQGLAPALESNLLVR